MNDRFFSIIPFLSHSAGPDEKDDRAGQIAGRRRAGDPPDGPLRGRHPRHAGRHAGRHDAQRGQPLPGNGLRQEVGGRIPAKEQQGHTIQQKKINLA